MTQRSASVRLHPTLNPLRRHDRRHPFQRTGHCASPRSTSSATTPATRSAWCAARGRWVLGRRGQPLPRLLPRLGLRPPRPLPAAGRRGRAGAGRGSSSTSRTRGTPSRRRCSAQALGERTDFGGQCFFCNSGTEANEAAIKLARLNGKPKGRYKIVTLTGSFHGRTMGALTATAQPKYHAGVEPMLPGFNYAPFGDLDAPSRRPIDAETCAIMLEPIQGEGGVNLPPAGFLEGLARAVRPARPAADLRRGADRHGPHRQVVRPPALGRQARTSSRWRRRWPAAWRWAG